MKCVRCKIGIGDTIARMSSQSFQDFSAINAKLAFCLKIHTCQELSQSQKQLLMVDGIEALSDHLIICSFKVVSLVQSDALTFFTIFNGQL